jgi:hypothetical protein
VKRFPGTVTLSDPLTFPQVFAVQDAIAATEELGAVTVQRYNHAILPGIFECVEEWALEGFPDNPTVDTFPATPSKASAELIGWLIREVVDLFEDSEPDPNA